LHPTVYTAQANDVPWFKALFMTFLKAFGPGFLITIIFTIAFDHFLLKGTHLINFSYPKAFSNYSLIYSKLQLIKGINLFFLRVGGEEATRKIQDNFLFLGKVPSSAVFCMRLLF
jgi:hypothetical protein